MDPKNRAANVHRKNLLKRWMKPILVLAGALAVYRYGLNYRVIGCFLLGVLIWVIIKFIVFVVPRLSMHNKIATKMKAESPEPMVKYYDKLYNVFSVEDKDVLFAYFKATIYVLYGQFDQAETHMREVDWSSKQPWVLAFNSNIKALIEYLKPGDYNEGLTLSRIAMEQAQNSIGVPGVEEVVRSYRVYVSIGLILTDKTTPEIVKEVEALSENDTFTDRLVSAWALRSYYHKAGMNDKADEMLKYIKENAPYCAPLQRLALSSPEG